MQVQSASLPHGEAPWTSAAAAPARIIGRMIVSARAIEPPDARLLTRGRVMYSDILHIRATSGARLEEVSLPKHTSRRRPAPHGTYDGKGMG